MATSLRTDTFTTDSPDKNLDTYNSNYTLEIGASGDLVVKWATDQLDTANSNDAVFRDTNDTIEVSDTFWVQMVCTSGGSAYEAVGPAAVDASGNGYLVGRRTSSRLELWRLPGYTELLGTNSSWPVSTTRYITLKVEEVSGTDVRVSIWVETSGHTHPDSLGAPTFTPIEETNFYGFALKPGIGGFGNGDSSADDYELFDDNVAGVGPPKTLALTGVGA